MSPERWQQVKEIFYAAQEREGAARAAYLAEACATDEALRREIESLLASYEKSEDFIEAPAFEDADIGEEKSETFVGQRVGYYRILSEIGHGGMGAVYLAERADAEFEQRVALKVIRRGLDTEDILRRFRNERQILAALNHPNIARLLDGGSTDAGLPYFVMEHIEGLPLNDYCDHNQLNTDERLKLFRKVCEAVSYAHRNLVIHRDLKPSNILVTHEGEPKLLDFGVAKFLSPNAGGQSLALTATGHRIMTPEYASPEQVRGEHVTTATDVYSLGVILYELLTGQRPYRTGSLRPDKLARAICEELPERPSAAFRDGERGATQHRGDGLANAPSSNITPSARSPISPSQLRGDLDNIVLMALRKEPARRYSSVEQFSEDVRRHLEGLPVLAREDSFSYRVSKFVRRHRAGVAAAFLVLLSLVGGLLITLWQSRVARRERDRAHIAQAKAERINQFLQETLGAPDPTKDGREVKMIDVLDKAVRRAETELVGQPEVLAEVRRTIGRTYYNLELYDKGEPLLRAALDDYRQIYGEDHPQTAKCLRDLANLLVYYDKLDESLPLLHRAVDIQRRFPPDDKHDFAETLLSLGAALYYKGDEASQKEARRIYEEAVDYCRRNLNADDPLLASALNELANTSDTETAIALYRKSIEILRPLPARKMDLATSLSNLGLSLMLLNHQDEAEAPLRESLALRRELFGADKPQVAVDLTHLSRLMFARSDYRQAETLAREAVEIEEKNLPAGHHQFHASFVALGRALMKTGKLAESEKHLRAARDLMSKRYGAEDARVAGAESALGECLALQRRDAEAEPLLKRGYELLNTQLGAREQATVEARQRLSAFYETRGKPDVAARFR